MEKNAITLLILNGLLSRGYIIGDVDENLLNDVSEIIYTELSISRDNQKIPTEVTDAEWEELSNSGLDKKPKSGDW